MASALQKPSGLYLGCCFSASSSLFLFLECGYKLYRGAWALFTPGANNPQLKAEGAEESGERGAPKAAVTGMEALSEGTRRIFNIEFASFF